MRQMPAPGVYVSLPNPSQGWEGDILVATGNKKGNTYWRPYMGKSKPPTYLLWTCVPSNKEIAANYIVCSNLAQALSYFP